ncbi:MAG: hypothetical protein HOH20_02290 [Rhodospirillaceae bacterium]|jgi:hypothetical protein|nr:hypothetical protein [Rhodospirillaceae bacterium]MBT5565613.1 hypothetical protein [Rhodospirillaceae bacterium]MBT6088382.1 hypothetical protein [Rhodospirillaceae bacterium]MBT6960877.1 hypothetical protein [Rhodospirillaceae bacterium]
MSMINQAARSRVTAITFAIAAGLTLSACGTSSTGDHISDDGFERGFSKFYERDNQYVAIIEESEEFFNDRNIEGAILSLDDDFTMYEITGEGVETRVQGIEEVRKAVGMSFGTGKWLGANVYKWGLTDNTLVQIEEDFFSTEDGGKRSVKTLVVFEHRDGKRWREWRFKPKAE